MAEIAESDKVLLAARLEASLGVASFGELSMRNGTFDALLEALRVSATGAAGEDAGPAVGVQRARRKLGCFTPELCVQEPDVAPRRVLALRQRRALFAACC